MAIQGGFGSDLAAAIDQAVADGVDVINYSVGGGASLTGADDLAYLFAADAGVFVATSASNNGPGPDTIGGPASVPWLTSVGASTQDRTFQGSASSSDGWEFFGASITNGTDELKLVDAADAGDELCNVGALDPAVVERQRRALSPWRHRPCRQEPCGLRGRRCRHDPVQPDRHAGRWSPTTTGCPACTSTSPTVSIIKDYIASAGDAAVAQINGGVAVTATELRAMADFSSRGPNGVAADIIKPDVTAPGVNILAGNTPTPVGFSQPESGFPGQLFQSISGTSMSSPHVAGLFALLKQAHPNWSPAAAKSALMTTSYQDVVKEDGVTRADPFDMGAGHVDPSGRVTRTRLDVQPWHRVRRRIQRVPRIPV